MTRLLTYTVVFWATLTVLYIARADPTPYNEPAMQAQAFLHGRAWFPLPDLIGENEQVQVGNYAMLLHPPLAAVLMMPVVWWRRKADGAGQLGMSLALGALAAVLAARFFLTFGLPLDETIWLTTFFVLGTTFGYEASLGAGWDFVLVVSTIPSLLALTEVYGKRRPLLIGLWGGLAVAARYDLVLALPFYLWMAWR